MTGKTNLDSTCLNCGTHTNLEKHQLCRKCSILGFEETKEDAEYINALEQKIKDLQKKQDLKLENYPKFVRTAYKNQTHAKYGITFEEYCYLYNLQDGCCAICKEIPKKCLVIDHCHYIGHVRGLLCQSCNLLLGLAKDDEFVLRRAIDYLNRDLE